MYMTAKIARSRGPRKLFQSSTAATITPANGITTAAILTLRSSRVTYRALPCCGCEVTEILSGPQKPATCGLLSAEVLNIGENLPQCALDLLSLLEGAFPHGQDH